LTAEQLEASRSERMRLNGRGQLTIDEARTWLEETGLCLFLPRRQFASFTAPTFVEAVAGEHTSSPTAKLVSVAEDLLVRLESEGVAVRLNLLGQPGEGPDFVVAAWVLPYVYALRGDRDWRRIPQLTGSRQVSALAIQAYKQLETGEATITQLRHSLGREVSESAVLRAITELWQQLRIIPVVSAAGKTPQWQLLRVRYQKAIAEGASTSQVTAISVLASIYLQAVIAASMEEVEMFLAPLTARSKVREVLRGLVATRQVHSLALGHAPHFYVAGTLPEFAAAPTMYASSSMPASSHFLRSYEHEEGLREPVQSRFTPNLPTPNVRAPHLPAPNLPAPQAPAPQFVAAPPPEAKPIVPAPTSERPELLRDKAQASRPRFSHQPAPTRSRKPAQSSTSGRVARRTTRDARTSSTRSNGASRHTLGSRWTKSTSKNGNGNGHGKNGHVNGHKNGLDKRHAPRATKSAANGNGFHSNGHARPANGLRKAKPAAARNLRNGHAAKAKSGAKPVSRRTDAARKGSRPTARANSRPDARSSRKPALTASTKAGNRSRYGFTASSNRRSKKPR
jgi:23S rRNA pseudouridine2605 synthase